MFCISLLIRLTFKKVSLSDPVFFPGAGSDFFLSPDPDRPKIRIRSGSVKKSPTKTRVKVEKNVIFHI